METFSLHIVYVLLPGVYVRKIITYFVNNFEVYLSYVCIEDFSNGSNYFCNSICLMYDCSTSLYTRVRATRTAMTTIFISFFHDDQNKNRFYRKINTKKNNL